MNTPAPKLNLLTPPKVREFSERAVACLETGEVEALAQFQLDAGMSAQEFHSMMSKGMSARLNTLLSKHEMKSNPSPVVNRGITYDPEQQAVIDCKAQVIVAKAFAGAGKTTVAVGYADARPSQNILYICLNKANADEAKRRFPANVDCKTTHSLAYASVGRALGSRVSNTWRAKQISDEMSINPRQAGAVRDTLLDFFATFDAALSSKNMREVALKYSLSDNQLPVILDHAKELWKRMCDPKGTVSVPHDAYLKMFALKNPILKYDAIILDEAQDTNPITAQIIKAQKGHANLLLIGDSHQSIYGFRGATNAMQDFENMGATVLNLPRTWRFGDRTAFLANVLLETFKGETVKIIGGGSDAKYNGGQAAYLARTNAQLFSMAAKRRGEGIYWVGGSGNYRLDAVLDAYHLYSGQHAAIRDPIIQRYRSWADYVEEQGETQDVEAKILIKAVEEYRDDIPDLIDDIKFNEVMDVSKAHRVLSTGHKSKGLEFDFVLIGDDFEVCIEALNELEEKGKIKESTKQEINLLYVVLTRAKKFCVLNTDMKEFMSIMQARSAKNDPVAAPKEDEPSESLGLGR